MADPPGGPKRQVTVRQENISTARITVTNVTGGGSTPLDGCKVEIVGVPAAKGTGTTNDKGVFLSKAFKPGTFKVTATKPGYGPVDPSNPIVRDGPLTQTITFISNQNLPGPPPVTNVVDVKMAQRNPRITVRSFLRGPPSAGFAALPDADVTMTGGITGKTDSQLGEFTSPELPFGKIVVTVKKAGFTPELRDASITVWSQEVELRADGSLASSTSSIPERDLVLDVVFIAANGLRTVALPPVSPKPIALWASGKATPHTVADDPRLPSPGKGDTAQGQDGWDVGVNYGGPAALRVLTTMIAPGKFALPSYVGGGVMQTHQIKRLAIVAHGAPGIMDVDQLEKTRELGVANPVEANSLSVPRLSAYSQEISDIGDLLDRDSVVLLAACNVADDPVGENLLKQLSNKWPSTKVVGIRSLGVVPDGNFKPGSSIAMFAGLRDTKYRHGTSDPTGRDYKDSAICADLRLLPWMSENSPHATVALDGNIIRRGTTPGA